MDRTSEAHKLFVDGAATFPFPIAAACRRYAEAAPGDPWAEWEMLSREVLGPALQYLSHLLLSDLVATGQKPPHLYHRIQSVLSRPMAGHYAGFLRETSRFYREKGIASRVPDLIDFLHRAEIEKALSGKAGEPLIGRLVDFRNLFAHGRIDDEKVVEGITAEVRDLTSRLLENIAFLEKYPIELEDGTPLMGADAKPPSGPPQAVVVRAEMLVLRPLLLKLNKEDLLLLEDHDLRERKLVYRGTAGHEKLGKKDMIKGEGQSLMQALADLLRKVRSEEALLDQLDWESFKERAGIMCERTLSLYEDMRKYVPKWYVPRVEWEGENGIFENFLRSDKALLALNGVQGTGKSALVSHLARKCADEGHAVLLVNAQRFSFADVAWSGNPYAEYFARELHASRPLDRDGFRSIVKRAAENRQVVLFIDAVNEVDGILSKWNRFKALELLLEWIAQIAQPGLKVVIGFRLDIFLEYDYLKADDLPKNLEEVSWPGDNPQKTWVTDLKSFDEHQAHELFNRLQEMPEMGMAPAMTWEQLKTALGKNLAEFTTNPLIFTVLLKSYHKQSHISIKDRDDLFFQYAERLTGANDLKKWPWWRKAWGFIRNGNITRKERFLADMTEKTAEEGGTAFMAEALSFKRKRDKRMLALINDPADTSFKDLQEGGLIAEEKIELKKGEAEITRRRITFVAEMMSVAMDRIFRKLNLIFKFRTTVRDILVMFAIVGFLVILIHGLSAAFGKKLLEKGISPDIVLSLKGSISQTFFLSVLPIYLFLSMILVLITWISSTPPMNAVGLIPRSFHRGKEMHALAVVNKLLLPAAIWIMISLVMMVIAGEKNFETPLALIGAAPLIGIIVFLVFFILPSKTALLSQVNPLPAPAQIQRRAAEVWLKYYLSSQFRKKIWRKRIMIAFAMLISIMLLLLLKRLVEFYVVPSSVIFGGKQFADSAAIRVFGRQLPGIIGKMWDLCIYIFSGIGLISLLLYGFIFPKNDIVEERRVLRNVQQRKPGRFYEKAIMAMVIINCVLMGIAWLAWNWSQKRAGTAIAAERTFLKNEGVLPSQYEFGAGKGVLSLDLSSSNHSLAGRVLNQKWKALENLSLPVEYSMPIDWKLLPEIKVLSSPAAASLYVSKKENPPAIHTFNAKGSFADFKNIPEQFPKLFILSLSEETARTSSSPFPLNFDVNLILRVISPGPAKMDWLTPAHCRYIVHLTELPDEQTLNLGLLERLFMPGNDLDPPVLRDAQGLRWLLLTFKAPPGEAFWRRLKDILSGSLPRLETLDLLVLSKEPLEIKDLKSCLSAKGKPAILKLIGRQIGGDTELFAKKEAKGKK